MTMLVSGVNCRILHSLPGRVRISCRGVKYLEKSKNEIELNIKKLSFIKDVYINTLTETVLILYDYKKADENNIKEVFEVSTSKYYYDIFKNEKSKLDKKSISCNIDKEESVSTILKRIGITTGALLYSYGRHTPRYHGNNIKRLLTLPSVVSLGLTAPMFRSGFEAIYKDKRPNEDTLTSTSILASLLLGKDRSALVIILLSNIAELLTAYTMEKTRKSIKTMLSLNEEYVWKMLDDSSLKKVKIKEVNKDDIVVVHTGEKICVDGYVISGEGVADQSPITGEYMPVIKRSEDKVFAGSVVKNGTLTLRTEKAGDDTVVSRILHLVEDAASKKAPIQNYADEFSAYLVPFSFLLSAATYLFTKSPTRALNMLVIDFCCGIKLSTATAFSASINNAVKNGVLIKGGNYIESMATADTLIFDKTGTLTEGKPQVSSIVLADKNFTKRQIIEIASAAEETSNHPLALGIMSKLREEGWDVPQHLETKTYISRGTETYIEDGVVKVGSKLFMEENNIDISNMIQEEKYLVHNGEKIIYVSLNEELIGIVGIQDKVRENMKKSINNLRYLGIDDIVLLTGDLKEHAEVTATKLGVDSFECELLPDDKAKHVLDLQSKGSKVIMVGDGVNDAPALAYADVGVSIGSKSTDIAIEASDITIQSEDPMMLPSVIRLSKKTMKIVRQNFGIVFSINSVGLLLSAIGVLPVFWGATLHNSSTILVVGNSARLLYFDMKRGRR
jgi:cation-transporting P-type ATPase C